MTDYFIALSFINISTLLLLLVCILTDTVINKIQKKHFLITVLVVFVICVMEVFSIIFNGAPVKYKWIHIVSNYLGFSLTPSVTLSLLNSIYPNKKTRYLYIFCAVYSVWLIISLIMNKGTSVFYIDENNNYFRAKGFFVYVIVYAVCNLFFFVENLILSLRFWHTNNIMLLGTMLFLCAGTTIQIINPEIQVTWLCVIISILLFYIYNDTLYQQIDELTFLKNSKCLKKWHSSQKKDAVIVVVEIDNYSKLKLNYNRSNLSQIVMEVSKNFNNFFKKYGTCYRLGSEEFCVIVDNPTLDFDELTKIFFVEYVKSNFKTQELPLLSIGYADISPKQDLYQVLSIADMKKRDFIKERMNYLYKSPFTQKN